MGSCSSRERSTVAPMVSADRVDSLEDEKEAEAWEIPAHLLLGVSVKFIRTYIAERGLSHAHTYEVSAAIRGEASEASVAEAHRWEAEVGVANLFASHAQARPIARTLEAIEVFMKLYKLDADSTFVWFDAFCIRQRQIADDVQNIGHLVEKIGKTVLCIDTWREPVCLTRVWCLYEIAHSIGGGTRETTSALHLSMCEDERRDFVRAFKSDEDAVVEQLTSFDARTAEASVEADRQQIFSLITAMGGFDHFNKETHTLLLNSLSAYKWFAFCEESSISHQNSQRSSEQVAAAIHQFSKLRRQQSSRIYATCTTTGRRITTTGRSSSTLFSGGASPPRAVSPRAKRNLVKEEETPQSPPTKYTSGHFFKGLGKHHVRQKRHSAISRRRRSSFFASLPYRHPPPVDPPVLAQTAESPPPQTPREVAKDTDGGMARAVFISSRRRRPVEEKEECSLNTSTRRLNYEGTGEPLEHCSSPQRRSDSRPAPEPSSPRCILLDHQKDSAGRRPRAKSLVQEYYERLSPEPASEKYALPQEQN